MTRTPSASATDALHTIETEMAVLARTLELLSRRGGVHRQMDRAGYLLLRTLEDTGPLSITCLAERIGLDGSTVTRQVAALEREGFAERCVDAADRRSAIVVPSAHGRHLMREVQRRRRERFEAMLDGWTEEELSTLGGLLARLNVAIAASALRGESGDGCPPGSG
jgi:DNA-binding MarR family transcriptional regulator